MYYLKSATGFASPTWMGYQAVLLPSSTALITLTLSTGTLSPTFATATTVYAAILPVATQVSGNFVFAFNRRAATAQDTTQIFHSLSSCLTRELVRLKVIRLP